MKLELMLAVIFCMAAPTMTAEVVDSTANGFTVKTTLSIKAAPDAVYRQIIHVGDWWDSAHTFSGDAHNLSIEEKPMGCWCEKLPNQGGVRHMQVVFLAPGKKLVMVGGLGPLQSMATAGTMTFQLSPAEGGTRLEVTYTVAGYFTAGLNTLAAPVDSVLGQQFARLKNYIEKGNPAPAPAQPRP
ncbi:MAG TPA: SRPBCC domain-containing protein [Candidatus Angelobacter sp.]|nr:SRPBCC domain-containing protein [Candidatus Angelobacter sp.]